MAKGLGAILAQQAIDEQERRIKNGDGIRCPLCGHDTNVKIPETM